MTSATAAGSRAEVVAPEDQVRAQIYRLIASFLSKPAGSAELAAGRGLLGDESPLGRALDRLAAACRAATPERIAEEYQTLFIGLGRGELVPYGSYYLTGFMQEKPLARLRADMNRLGIVRTPDSREPEDHAASILETMAGLIDGAYGPQLTVPAQKLFYESHIASWMSHFFRDLEATETSQLYASIGAVGRHYLEIETEAFKMA